MESGTWDYESDFMANLLNLQACPNVYIDLTYDIQWGPIYDSPLGPLGYGCSVYNTLVRKIYLENERDLMPLYLANPKFKREIDVQIRAATDYFAEAKAGGYRQALPIGQR